MPKVTIILSITVELPQNTINKMGSPPEVEFGDPLMRVFDADPESTDSSPIWRGPVSLKAIGILGTLIRGVSV